MRIYLAIIASLGLLIPVAADASVETFLRNDVPTFFTETVPAWASGVREEIGATLAPIGEEFVAIGNGVADLLHTASVKVEEGTAPLFWNGATADPVEAAKEASEPLVW